VTTSLAYDSTGALANETATVSGSSVCSYSLARFAEFDCREGRDGLGVTTQYAFAYDSAGRLAEVKQNGT
jgi:hypothetical protein